jgi:hypothetical protein
MPALLEKYGVGYDCQIVPIPLREGVKAKFISTKRYSNQAQRIISRINKIYNVIYFTDKIPYTEVLKQRC